MGTCIRMHVQGEVRMRVVHYLVDAYWGPPHVTMGPGGGLVVGRRRERGAMATVDSRLCSRWRKGTRTWARADCG